MQETDLDFRAHLLKIKSLGADVLAIGGQIDAIARISQQSYRGRHPVQGAPRRGLRRLQRAGARARRRRGGRPDLRGRVQLQGRASGGAGLRQDGAREVQGPLPGPRLQPGLRDRADHQAGAEQREADADRRLAEGRSRSRSATRSPTSRTSPALRPARSTSAPIRRRSAATATGPASWSSTPRAARTSTRACWRACRSSPTSASKLLTGRRAGGRLPRLRGGLGRRSDA